MAQRSRKLQRSFQRPGSTQGRHLHAGGRLHLNGDGQGQVRRRGLPGGRSCRRRKARHGRLGLAQGPGQARQQAGRQALPPQHQLAGPHPHRARQAGRTLPGWPGLQAQPARPPSAQLQGGPQRARQPGLLQVHLQVQGRQGDRPEGGHGGLPACRHPSAACGGRLGSIQQQALALGHQPGPELLQPSRKAGELHLGGREDHLAPQLRRLRRTEQLQLAADLPSPGQLQLPALGHQFQGEGVQSYPEPRLRPRRGRPRQTSLGARHGPALQGKLRPLQAQDAVLPAQPALQAGRRALVGKPPAHLQPAVARGGGSPPPVHLTAGLHVPALQQDRGGLQAAAVQPHGHGEGSQGRTPPGQVLHHQLPLQLPVPHHSLQPPVAGSPAQPGLPEGTGQVHHLGHHPLAVPFGPQGHRRVGPVEAQAHQPAPPAFPAVAPPPRLHLEGAGEIPGGRGGKGLRRRQGAPRQESRQQTCVQGGGVVHPALGPKPHRRAGGQGVGGGRLAPGHLARCREAARAHRGLELLEAQRPGFQVGHHPGAGRAHGNVAEKPRGGRKPGLHPPAPPRPFQAPVGIQALDPVRLPPGQVDAGGKALQLKLQRPGVRRLQRNAAAGRPPGLPALQPDGLQLEAAAPPENCGLQLRTLHQLPAGPSVHQDALNLHGGKGVRPLPVHAQPGTGQRPRQSPGRLLAAGRAWLHGQLPLHLQGCPALPGRGAHVQPASPDEALAANLQAVRPHLAGLQAAADPGFPQPLHPHQGLKPDGAVRKAAHRSPAAPGPAGAGGSGLPKPHPVQAPAHLLPARKPLAQGAGTFRHKPGQLPFEPGGQLVGCQARNRRSAGTVIPGGAAGAVGPGCGRRARGFPHHHAAGLEVADGRRPAGLSAGGRLRQGRQVHLHPHRRSLRAPAGGGVVPPNPAQHQGGGRAHLHVPHAPPPAQAGGGLFHGQPGLAGQLPVQGRPAQRCRRGQAQENGGQGCPEHTVYSAPGAANRRRRPTRSSCR